MRRAAKSSFRILGRKEYDWDCLDGSIAVEDIVSNRGSRRSYLSDLCLHE